jgi:hypothetical protein
LGNETFPKLSEIARNYMKYDLTHYLKYEQFIIKLLNYKLDYETTYSSLKMVLENTTQDFKQLAFRILEVFIDDIRFVDFKPIEAANAIICLASDIYSTNYKRQLVNVKAAVYMNCYIVIKR